MSQFTLVLAVCFARGNYTVTSTWYRRLLWFLLFVLLVEIIQSHVSDVAD